MGTIADSMDGIFSALREAALTLQQGGGIGYDFSTLRPKGALVEGVGADASGPVSFMEVWDAMCRTIMSAGCAARRHDGDLARATIPTSRISSPPSARPGRLSNFNLSVLVSDAFMAAVKADGDWDAAVRRQGLSHREGQGAVGHASCAPPMIMPSRA